MNFDYHYILLGVLIVFYHFIIFRYWKVFGITGRGGNHVWQSEEMFTMGMMYCLFLYVLIHIALMEAPDPAFLGILTAGAGGATYISSKNKNKIDKFEEDDKSESG